MPRPKKREPPTTAQEWDDVYIRQLKTDEARAFYAGLISDIDAAGQLNSATRSLVRDAAAQEDVIIAAMADIKRNGAVERIEQGSQKLRVENRYLKAKLRAEARKQDILEALGLLPGKKGPGRPTKGAKAEDDPADALDREWEDFDAAD